MPKHMMLVTLSLLILLSCTSLTPKLESDAAASRGPASLDAIDQVYKTLGYGLMPEAPQECRLSCDEVELWAGVRKPKPGEEAMVGHPQSVLDLLQTVKQRRPEFFRNYTLAYESFSLQKASFENPRVVAYSCDGKAIMTYNGKPGQLGYERLEFSCFNDHEKTFEFKEMTFPKDAVRATDIADLSPEQKRQPVVLSGVNSSGDRRCTQCHGDPAKPIWEGYNLWPRFYRGFDDDLQRSGEPEFVKWEQRKFATYFNKSRPYGRYQPLIDRVPDQYGDDRPNDALGIRLYYLNGERIVRELQKLGQPFRDHIYSFTHALLCNQTPEHLAQGFAEPGVYGSARAREMLMSSYRNIANKLKYFEGISGLSIARFHDNSDFEKKFFFDKFSHFYPEHQYTYNIGAEAGGNYTSVERGLEPANIEKVVAPLGVDIQNWSLNLLGGYQYSSGQASMNITDMQSMLERPFLKAFLLQDAEVATALIKFRSVPWEWGEDTGKPEKSPRLDRAWEALCGILDQRRRTEILGK